MGLDVIIIGGGFAGHAAAIQLGRARRKVLLLDTGRPRNRFAASSHGFLGQDGVPPDKLVKTFQLQLAAYASVHQVPQRATAVSSEDNGFAVGTDSESYVGRSIILAGGVRDHLPDISGLKNRWGTSVLHCPYCHGYEMNCAAVGVLGASDIAVHQAMLVRDWGPTTLFTQGTLALSKEQRDMLGLRDVSIEDVPIAELVGHGKSLEAVRLADGRLLQLSGLYVAPKTVVVGSLARDLGCDFEEGPTGRFIATDQFQKISVPGVFAAGDAAAPVSNAMMSAAAGARAGIGAHASLIFE
ncbi:MAG: NAD(P)/FAD-dependent oxidoreductase [Pseudomonadota bacterium]